MSIHSLLGSQVLGTHHTLSNAYAQAHLHAESDIQIQREFAVTSPVLPLGCVASTRTKMAAPDTLQTQFLSSNRR